MTPPERSEPRLSLRALIIGLGIGALLSLANLYSGLKVGLGFNMSITAALLGFMVSRGYSGATGRAPSSLSEINLTQTAASSASTVVMAGLIAPIPALTLMTGRTLSWPWLSAWVFSVCALGILVAAGLRRPLLRDKSMTFPNGMATASTLQEMFAESREAIQKGVALLGAAFVGAAVKIGSTRGWLERWPIPGSLRLRTDTDPGASQPPTLANLTFALDPTLLLVGVGALIGFRSAFSVFLGALLAWGGLAPWILENEWVDAGAQNPTTPWFGTLRHWLLWPGIALMVVGSLTSFFLGSGKSLRSMSKGLSSEILTAFRSKAALWSFGAVFVLTSLFQIFLFEISWWMAALGVVLSFFLALVAARVSGETGITTSGPLGKVTQFFFGLLSPGQAVPNLMAANLTAGAASQCADLMNDLKTGEVLGTRPQLQIRAQVLGALAGSLMASAAYLWLLPDPANQLQTEEWPAPAATAWMAVAQLMSEGISSLPPGCGTAIIVAAIAGVLVTWWGEGSEKRRRYLPSLPAMGLAFVIPAWLSLSLFFGGLAALIARRFFANMAARFLVVAASGLIAGESLTGMITSLSGILFP